MSPHIERRGFFDPFGMGSLYIKPHSGEKDRVKSLSLSWLLVEVQLDSRSLLK